MTTLDRTEADVLVPGMPEALERRLEAALEVVPTAAGTVVITAGEPVDGLYFVRAGELEVSHVERGRPVVLTRVGPRTVLGTVSFLAGGNATATVRALQPATLLRLPRSAAEQLAARDPEVHHALVLAISRQLAQSLVERSAATAVAIVDHERLEKGRRAAGLFVVLVALLFSAYTITLPYTAQASQRAGGSTWVTSLVLAAFAVGTGLALARSGYPTHVFGLSWGRWKQGLVEALGLSAVLGVLVVAGKLVLVADGGPLAGQPVFRLPQLLAGDTGGLSAFDLAARIAIYALLVPVQELIARGALQSGLQAFLVGRHRTLLAIVTSNLLFAATHAHLSPTLALLALVPGLAWGWLYARHGSLLGVTVSHVLVGWFAFFVVGFRT